MISMINVHFNNINYDWIYFFDTYKKYVKKSHTVLEIGASNVERTIQLAGECRKLLGVELMLERLPKSWGNVTYIQGDWQKLTKVVQKNSIDIAVSSHVIEHVPDDEVALKEMYSVLKPGGIALFNTPNRNRLTCAVYETIFGKRTFPFWEHQREYTDSDLLLLIKKTKFKIVKIEPLVFGIHGGHIFIYTKNVPEHLRKYCNFWQIILKK